MKRLKEYWIALIGIPAIAVSVLIVDFDQLPTADNYWVSGYDIIGSDTLLVDSLTGVGNPAWVITYCADQLANIDSGYISAKSLARLNGQPITTLFPNANYADTTFFEMAERAPYNGGDVLPYRLESIVQYSAGLSGQDSIDVNTVFNVPAWSSTWLEVCSTCTYTSWGAAITAATATDTIILYEQLLTESPATDKELTHIGVGYFRNHPATGRAFYQYGSDFYMHYLDLKSVDNFGIRTSTNAEVYPVISNCVIYGTANLLNTTDNNDDITFNNCIIKGYLNHYGRKIITNECLFPSNDYVFRFRGVLESTNDLIEKQSVSILLYEDGFTDSIKFNNTISEGVLMSIPTITGTVEYIANGGKIKSLSNYFSNTLSSGIVNFSFDSVQFERGVYSTNPIIRRLGDGNILFNNCYSKDFKGYLVNATKDAVEAQEYSFIMSGGNFESDTNIRIAANNYFFEINNSSIQNPLISTNNTGEARHTKLYNCEFMSTDSVSVRCLNGKTILDNCTFDSDAPLYTEFANTLVNDSSLTISNCLFDVDSDQTSNVINASMTYVNRFQEGILMSGNKFVLPPFYGKNQELHMYLIFNNSVKFEYNNIYGGTLTCVAKNDNDEDLSNIIFGNVFNECTYPVFIRSFPNTKVYGNTFKNNSVTLNSVIWIDDNGGSGVNSDSIQFINNIIDSPTGSYYYFGSVLDTIGFNSSNNILFDSDSIYLNGSYLSYDTWTSLGYDLDSYNTDPNLSVDLCPQIPTDAKWNGTDVGQDSLLSCGTAFPNPEKILATIPYGIGAVSILFNLVPIDNYISDTTMGAWAVIINSSIYNYTGSVDTIQVGVHTFNQWWLRANTFISAVPETATDTIDYPNVDTFEQIRTKYNNAVDSVNN